jgi:catechol 2,3-dioxygenase-like lactoylglutathione lyase family enzyme
MFVGEGQGIMAVTGMHHFNIRVSQAEIGALKSFYCDILGFRVGPRPPFQSAGFWLYAGQLPVLHLTQMNSGEVAAPGSPNSLPDARERRSAIDHRLHLYRKLRARYNYRCTVIHGNANERYIPSS